MVEAHRCALAPERANGIESISDIRIQGTTSRIANEDEPNAAADAFWGFASGVGIASISAILAAARPSIYPVIDVFALMALLKYKPEGWQQKVKRDPKGRPIAERGVYADFVQTCRRLAARMSKIGKRE